MTKTLMECTYLSTLYRTARKRDSINSRLHRLSELIRGQQDGVRTEDFFIILKNGQPSD